MSRQRIILGLIEDTEGNSGQDGKTPTTIVYVDCFFEKIKIEIPGKLTFSRGDKVKIEIGGD